MLPNNLNILYEDADILVVVKPHGIATQSKKIGSPDMVNILKRYLFMKKPRQGEPYLGIVHRLDQPVKGILVFAKNKKAAANLSNQLTNSHSEYGFNKYYYAVVHGRPEHETGNLVNYILSDSKNNTSRLCPSGTPFSKEARLHYGVISSYETEDDVISELEIRLDTGRHHQIRLQLAGMGCPIVGDTKYNPKAAELAKKAGRKWQELKLCAFHLSFNHPKSGEVMNFEIEP